MLPLRRKQSEAPTRNSKTELTKRNSQHSVKYINNKAKMPRSETRP